MVHVYLCCFLLTTHAVMEHNENDQTNSSHSERSVDLAHHDYMKETLDDITKYFEGYEAEFDPVFYKKLKRCMGKWGDKKLHLS